MITPGRLGLVVLARRQHPAPVPLSQIRTLRRLAWGEDPLFPKVKPLRGTSLRHPILRSALSDCVLGTWSFGPRSLEYLEATVASSGPSLILEFGSGVSTVCLAQYLADYGALAPSRHGRIVSIDQSDEHAARTDELLGRLGLTDRVELIVAPLRRRVVDGRMVSTYELEPGTLERSLGDDQIDLVVIDGPAAEEGARYGTLPVVRKHVRDGALVLLDDALRDAELDVSNAWSALSYLNVEGIVPVEHGILRGHFVR